MVFNPPQNVVSTSCTPSVEQLSSTVSEASTNFISDKRLGQSFYHRVDYVADRIADVTYTQLYRRGKAGTLNQFGRLLLVFEDMNHVMHRKFPDEKWRMLPACDESRMASWKLTPPAWGPTFGKRPFAQTVLARFPEAKQGCFLQPPTSTFRLELNTLSTVP